MASKDGPGKRAIAPVRVSHTDDLVYGARRQGVLEDLFALEWQDAKSREWRSLALADIGILKPELAPRAAGTLTDLLTDKDVAVRYRRSQGSGTASSSQPRLGEARSGRGPNESHQ